MDLNKVQIIWNVTKDIELKQTPTGQHVCSFSIATNRTWLDASGIKQEVAEFHNIVLWGKLAEISEKYFHKGMKIYIEGRLQTKVWEWPDGTKRYKTEIVWESVIMLNSKKEWTETIKKTSSKKEEEISIEDIPF